MDSSTIEITHEFPAFFRVHKDGRIQRFKPFIYVPPTVDPQTGVISKDITIAPEIELKARIFMPEINGQDQKLPLVLHFHGGGFCIGSPFDAIIYSLLTSLASKARAIVVSVDYRLAPEHPLPIAYDDSWSALQWMAAHSTGKGPDPWLNQHADFGRVFLGGESAGANIAHHVAVRVGSSGFDGFRVHGLFLVHAYFVDHEPNKFTPMIRFLYPGSSGLDDDPKLSPKADPGLCKMGCSKVMVCVASKDLLKPRGEDYCEILKNRGWEGTVELVESEGEDHCFHLFNPTNEKAVVLMQTLASFINQD
ncbi:2-hydroxyisoflavanone dehydratase [Actinidia chinensis var. chinensis]|uniref:2-hydroxyisoflavanone dehydratase n=1 Tax=Actinidia chinensis var. chinensis TaxID=1590841 RepID=A0A2R6RC47_ACTCC|nr:2-hydroxyisoflavanone dehydratase [Actinidia chinensis var. chinensis]